ncbi:heavy-metal-associated domain-containing protein [Mycobacterium manitobense]|uniref:Heavy-metal-associated domain-containing protein n=1 Tax=[Mycobacterium] manitobense TaxID=190147 RepID=A0A9X2YRH8_9MYCO|nr:cation transporter [[Mycobacterium] manitobense]MCV7172225.1 heavy-metal-associated domain-containing protein [[Mycobacterium] manitobense]
MGMTLNVRGMSCGHCVAAITSAVAPLPGVTDVAVDLEHGLVTVEGPADETSVVAAIEDTGYDVDRAA